MALKTVFENENSRSAVYDEDKLIGECDFSRQGDHWVIYHTEVDPQYGGKGLAWDLVKCAADQAASENMKLECTCSYAAKALGSRQDISRNRWFTVFSSTVISRPSNARCRRP